MRLSISSCLFGDVLSRRSNRGSIALLTNKNIKKIAVESVAMPVMARRARNDSTEGFLCSVERLSGRS